MMGHGLWGFGFGGGLMMIVFWALLIIGTIYLVKMLSDGGGLHATKLSPILTPTEVLLGRYARGEITKEEFEQIKSDIS